MNRIRTFHLVVGGLGIGLLWMSRSWGYFSAAAGCFLLWIVWMNLKATLSLDHQFKRDVILKAIQLYRNNPSLPQELINSRLNGIMQEDNAYLIEMEFSNLRKSPELSYIIPDAERLVRAENPTYQHLPRLIDLPPPH